MGENVTKSHKILKFAKIFSFESFPLYNNYDVNIPLWLQKKFNSTHPPKNLKNKKHKNKQTNKQTNKTKQNRYNNKQLVT